MANLDYEPRRPRRMPFLEVAAYVTAGAIGVFMILFSVSIIASGRAGPADLGWFPIATAMLPGTFGAILLAGAIYKISRR